MAKHKIMISADVPGVDEGLRSFLRKAIRTALDTEGVDVPCEINVLITNDGGIHRINLDMRGVDAPTDVLSFPMFDLKPGDKPSGEDADPATGLAPLGDMCISLERAKAQAKGVRARQPPGAGLPGRPLDAPPAGLRPPGRGPHEGPDAPA